MTKKTDTAQDVINMARAAKSFDAQASDSDGPPPSDEMFLRAATVFAMLTRMGSSFKEMAVIVDNLDSMTRDHAIALIAQAFSDNPPSTPHRAALFATSLPDDFAAALQSAVADNRKALGLPPQCQVCNAVSCQTKDAAHGYACGGAAGCDVPYCRCQPGEVGT